MAHAQKPEFVFPWKGRVHLNRWGRQFIRLLATEVCASAWVMLDTSRPEVAWEYWLHTPFASFPHTSPPVRHRVPPGSERALHLVLYNYVTLILVPVPTERYERAISAIKFWCKGWRVKGLARCQVPFHVTVLSFALCWRPFQLCLRYSRHSVGSCTIKDLHRTNLNLDIFAL